MNVGCVRNLRRLEFSTQVLGAAIALAIVVVP